MFRLYTSIPMQFNRGLNPSRENEYWVAARTAHVWVASLENLQWDYDRYHGCLPVDEQGRASRFHFERDRELFVFSHAVLRCLLGRYLNLRPDKICFSEGLNGKPVLREGGVFFNLSHSGRMALIGIARAGPLGVDIEAKRREIELDSLTKRCFSDEELRDFESVPACERLGVFYRYWTLKEAYMKADGRGLGIPLKSFTVRGVASADESLRLVSGDESLDTQWRLWRVDVPDPYAAALCTSSHVDSVRQIEWDPKLLI